MCIQSCIAALRRNGFRVFDGSPTRIAIPLWDQLVTTEEGYMFLSFDKGTKHTAFSLSLAGWSQKGRLQHEPAARLSQDVASLVTTCQHALISYQALLHLTATLPSLLPSTDLHAPGSPDWTFLRPGLDINYRPCWHLSLGAGTQPHQGLGSTLTLGMDYRLSVNLNTTSLSGSRLAAIASFFQAVADLSAQLSTLPVGSSAGGSTIPEPPSGFILGL